MQHKLLCELPSRDQLAHIQSLEPCVVVADERHGQIYVAPQQDSLAGGNQTASSPELVCLGEGYWSLDAGL